MQELAGGAEATSSRVRRQKNTVTQPFLPRPLDITVPRHHQVSLNATTFPGQLHRREWKEGEPRPARAYKGSDGDVMETDHRKQPAEKNDTARVDHQVADS